MIDVDADIFDRLFALCCPDAVYENQIESSSILRLVVPYFFCMNGNS